MQGSGLNIGKQLKIFMINIDNLFSLEGQTAYVFGGSGLIGIETIRLLKNHNAKVINLDIKNYNKDKKNEEIFVKIDCTKLEKIDKKLTKIFNKNNYPDIFINCTSPPQSSGMTSS